MRRHKPERYHQCIFRIVHTYQVFDACDDRWPETDSHVVFLDVFGLQSRPCHKSLPILRDAVANFGASTP